jgi:outer membrane protein OmpA-like peptidoglycan-associated protein
MNSNHIYRTGVLFLVLFGYLIVIPTRANARQDSIQTKQAIIQYLNDSASSSRLKLRAPSPDIQRPMNPLRLNVPFDFNSAGLTRAAEHQLDELGEALRSPDIGWVKVKLTGHTDERGSQKYNLALSQRRVETAKNYITKKFGIEPGRIVAIGYGKLQPIIRNAKEEAQHAVNRRVEISPFRDEKQSSVGKLRGSGTLQSDVRGAQESENTTDVTDGTLKLKWGVLHVRDQDNEELIHYRGESTLQSGDTYRIYAHPGSACFVYIYQVDSKGKGAWLFPRNDIQDKNPLIQNDYWFPSRNTTFKLDESSGSETIYLVASRKPAHDLENYIKQGIEFPTVEVAPETVTCTIKLRGLGEIKTGPAPGEGKEESIEITDATSGTNGGLHTGKPSRHKLLNNMAEIFSNSGDFYVKISFRHK